MILSDYRKIYAFKVAGYRRRIFGPPEAITVGTGYSL